MGLRLLTGPANAGKVALLLERYLAALDREPVLIVPNRSDVDRVERDLLSLRPALLGGTIGTFDDLFAAIAAGEQPRRLATDVQRGLLVGRVIGSASLNGLRRSARYGGFADALAATIAELEAGFADPGSLQGDLARLYGSYRGELDRLGLWDRELLRRRAAERVAGELAAWDGRPLFAYGFEDLTGAEWALLHALAGRVEVTVSLPYEPGRAAFASLARTASDLAGLADGQIEELPPRYHELAPAALAHLERTLFTGSPIPAPPSDGAIRFLEGAGARSTFELVGEEILGLLRAGTEAHQIGVICPSLDRVRGPLETAFTTLGVPFVLEGSVRLGQLPFGQSLLALLRFAWGAPRRRDLFSFLRSPYSGMPRAHADYLEGRLRGRAVQDERVEQEALRLRGQPLPYLDSVRAAASPLTAVGDLAAGMLRSAYGLEAPPVGARSQLDLRALEWVGRLLGELEAWQGMEGDLAPPEVIAALEQVEIPLGRANEPGRVAVLDLMRARTRRFEAVYVLGLEEGTFPRRSRPSPFLDDETRRELERAGRGTRFRDYDPVARERYLFYSACTRPSVRLTLVREAASDDGAPREASPFWHEVRSLLREGDVERWTLRRPLSRLVWPLEEAPTERERLRSLASLASVQPDAASACARANGWGRQLERALHAFVRPTTLTHPQVLERFRSQPRFGVTELESFAECSSIWLLERIINPRSIDAEVDARLRGSIAHQALYKFFSGLPKHLGVEQLDESRLDEGLAFLRTCLDDALKGVRLELTSLQQRELEQGLRRDLEAFVCSEARSERGLVPRRFEVAFGSDRAAPELQRGLDLGEFLLAGKIDRIDVDPYSTRGIVQDYKSGKTAHSAAQIESELKLQIPLYMLVLRDLVGIEPLGGVYQPLAGDRKPRGLLRAAAKEDGLPGFAKNDYLDEDEFWGRIDQAQAHARSFVARIRAGDVRHDPKGGFPCPSWCELAPMCRVVRQ